MSGSLLPSTGRPRRGRKGTREFPHPCPLCGSRKSMDVNPDLGVFQCWICHYGGAIPQSWRAVLPPPGVQVADPTLIVAQRASCEFPLFARLEIERRGFDPDWLIATFGLRWDGTRILWPAGRGFVAREVFPWLEPKTRTLAGPEGKDLIGSHRLFPGCHVVLVEGDYKMAAVPLPWIGVGLNGLHLTGGQLATLTLKSPASILVALDGGYESEAERIVSQFPYTPAAVVPLPRGCGPDDIPRHELTNHLLDGWERLPR